MQDQGQAQGKKCKRLIYFTTQHRPVLYILSCECSCTSAEIDDVNEAASVDCGVGSEGISCHGDCGGDGDGDGGAGGVGVGGG